MHILIASNEDVAFSLEAAKAGEEVSWIVPKRAAVGDECVLSHWKLGLYATGQLESEASPSPTKTGQYLASLGNIQLLGEGLPHALLTEEIPEWKWPSYPKSYTTISGDLETLVWDLIASFVDERSPDIDESVSEEGAARLRIHQVRERDAELTERKRQSVLSIHGVLACEICRFDFEAKYGSLGSGFSEVHHLRPLSQRKSNEPTRLEELSIVCSNCHRMLHRKGLIEPAQLQSMIVAHRKCEA
jgi:predicted HNH restriction endonuclease